PTVTPDTSVPSLPATRIQHLARLVHIELPARVARVEARGGIEEIGGGLGAAAVDLLLDGSAVYQQVQRLANGRVTEKRMRGLETRPLAIDFFPRVGLVELNVFGIARGPDLDPPFAALLKASEDVVLDLQVPGVVVFAGLEHGPGGRGRIATTLHLDGVEKGPVGHVVGLVDLSAHEIARLELHELERPGAHGLDIGGGGPAARPLACIA